jgi:hypothetical protein
MNGMGEKVLPLRAHEIHRAPRKAKVDLEKNGAANAGFFHGLQIRRHALLRQVAVHEIPIDPGLRAGGRLGKAFGQRISGVQISAHRSQYRHHREEAQEFVLFSRVNAHGLFSGWMFAEKRKAEKRETQKFTITQGSLGKVASKGRMGQMGKI